MLLPLLVAGCGGKQTVAPGKIEPIPALMEAPIRFDDVTEQVGVGFHHVSGNSSEKHFPAANGSGVAMFDFDGDGRQDLYFLTARFLPFSPGSAAATNRLYRNRWPEAFEDVSVPSGLAIAEFCHGVLAADLDNDGFTDLALTRYGGTRLLRNNGDGTFAAVNSFKDDRWGTSICALDCDEDGVLDLYAAHYGLWSLETNERCGTAERRQFCSPNRIPPTMHALYRGEGDWRFRDVTAAAGVGRRDGRGQGVCACDLNDDGHIDLWVANDQSPNFVYLGDGKGAFRDVSTVSGAAYSNAGTPQAGMAADCGDVDRDGLPDLFVTNFRKEYNALYMNIGEGMFVDKSQSLGVAAASRETVNWGAKLCDFDNDGWLDLFVTTGHVDDNVEDVPDGAKYRTSAMVWRNVGGKFVYLKDPSPGPFFATAHCGRGAAFGDLDDDGRVDVALNQVDERASVLHNKSPPPAGNEKPWVRFSLIGRLSNRDAVGAKVTLQGAGLPGKGIVQYRTSGASYLSSHDPRVLIGLGATKVVEKATIRWPGGRVTILSGVKAGSDLLVLEPLD